MKTQYIQPISHGISLEKINDILLVRVEHSLGSALVSLQGAQLLSWQPKAVKQSVLWLSEVEPFEKGKAIRGGVPICYPWFGSVKQPSHGTVRLREWALSHYEMDDDYAYLEFSLFDVFNVIEAKMEMIFSESCQLAFTHYGAEPAQVALHSYFNVADIQQTVLQGLPTQCFDSLTQQHTTVPSPRVISENVDCIYQAQSPNFIQDKGNKRTIEISHLEASEVVVWNPWHKVTSGMSEHGYQTMLCVETARINQPLKQGDKIEVKFQLV